MDRQFTEQPQLVKSYPLNSEQAENQRGEAVQGERPHGKRVDKGARHPQTFKLSSDLIARLGHYVVDRSRKDGRRVEKSEVAEEAIDEFLTREGY